MSSSSNPEPKRKYDVFFTSMIDFPFTYSLKSSLRDAEIKTFIDDDDKEGMKPSLLRAIEVSRISIVVFSKQYGYSRRSLRILGKVMECYRRKGQVVMPLYVFVNPWEVREQNGQFGKAFEGLVEGMCVSEDEALRWRRDLAEFALLNGWDVSTPSVSVGHIIDFIKGILFAYHHVGLERRVAEVLKMCVSDAKVRIIGILGEEGIGKTTIAKAVYNEISSKFESSIFLENIEDVWGRENGLLYLLQQVVSNIHNTNDIKIQDIGMGYREMEILHNKKVLLVLDDVNNVDQIMTLRGSWEMFNERSTVIITTRHKHLLDHFEVECMYKVEEMDEIESLEHLSWHAFKHSSPTDDFINLSRKAITYCFGIPLALQVLGSLLVDKTRHDWKKLFKKLTRFKKNAIPQILQLSYGCLENSEKDIFLDIASFYLGKDKQYVTESLNDCGYHAEVDINVLIMRSLLKVDKNSKLQMHGCLQEMARGITNHHKTKPQYIYDVFLSFRGEDTRKSFVSHLYATLKNAGKEVFMDDRLMRGENISSSLLQAIEGSRISIIIFSTNYAGSRWCLQELEKIMECHRNTSHEVLPIFYGVQASDVRKQTGTFGKVLEELVTVSASKKRIWRRALTEAANLSGWDSYNYRTDTDLINHVVESVIMKLDNNTYLFVADHPVGLESRVQEIIKLLTAGSNEVIIVGIWGMGGIGKTTTAKAIYNEIGRKFEGKSFLANIRQLWEQENSEVNLQEQLLLGILKARKIKLHNNGLGKALMKERLCHKRVLIVLDDVDKLDQLSALCGSREWFGQGSRIIITTRDERLLHVLQVDKIYNMKELDDCESLELFSWHAFKQASPTKDFFELSRRVIAYSGGLPLALEVLGSYLFDRVILAWESVLEKLQKIPNDQIHRKLKISYDGLSDDMEKDIFLDICCFFIGKDRSYVTQICGPEAEIGITRLIELSLVKVDKNNKLEMHDLIQAMGREIIREMSPNEPGKRARLCVHDDVLDVLMNNTGTIVIKGLALSFSRSNALSFSTKAFEEMKRLKFLQLGHIKLSGDYEYLSKDLQWLCWHGFPLRHMPENFYQKNVVAIDLKYSSLTKVWKKNKLLERLKILNLSHSHHLTRTPDFSGLPNLEKLILKDCSSLSMIHSSIGDLKCLILLNLKDCKGLNHLPRSTYKLKSLKTLILSGCSKLDKLEEGIEQMESLTTLMADNTAMTEVPFSLVRSKSIKYVAFYGCEGLSRDIFPSLIWSWMSPTNYAKSLTQAFVCIPFLFQSLWHGLYAKSSEKLEAESSRSQTTRAKAPKLIGYHEPVHVVGSTNFNSKLEAIPSRLQGLQIGFHGPAHTTRSTNSMNYLIIQVGCNKAIDFLLGDILQQWSDGEFDDRLLPSDNYPLWVTFKGEDSSLLFEVPQVNGCDLKGVILCIVYSSTPDAMTSVYPVSVLIKNSTRATINVYKRDAITTFADEQWQDILSNFEPCHEVEVTVTFGHKFIVKKTIIYLLYDEDRPHSL